MSGSFKGGSIKQVQRDSLSFGKEVTPISTGKVRCFWTHVNEAMPVEPKFQGVDLEGLN
jgi:hypothetical protein